jgi:hypothetical protein
MNKIEKMTGMTDEEADAWDDYFTQNPPDVDPDKNRIRTGEGPVARMVLSLSDLDSDVAEYVCAQALASHQTYAQAASAIIRRELSKSA